MARIECPADDCHGLLQEPFTIPGTQLVHDTYCPQCRTKYPELNDRFEREDAGGRGSPEEDLRYERNRFWYDIMGFAVYDLEQGHRPGPGGTRQTLGLPDTLLFGHGLEVWIEYKDTGRKQTDHQKAFQRHAEANGGIYLLIYPETSMKDILEGLRAHPDWRNEP